MIVRLCVFGGGGKESLPDGHLELLEESTVLQVVLDDDVGDSVEDELHVLGVGGTREMRVDLLGVLPLVQVLELTLDVGSRLLVGVGPWEVQNWVTSAGGKPEREG